MARTPSLSRYLRDARIQRGLSVAALADRAGVTATCVYLWERGTTRPREVNLRAVCKALKLPINSTLELAGL